VADPAASDPNNPTATDPGATVRPAADSEQGTAAPDAGAQKPTGTTPRPGQ
jgi:hypothetical protein